MKVTYEFDPLELTALNLRFIEIITPDREQLIFDRMTGEPTLIGQSVRMDKIHQRGVFTFSGKAVCGEVNIESGIVRLDGPYLATSITTEKHCFKVTLGATEPTDNTIEEEPVAHMFSEGYKPPVTA